MDIIDMHCDVLMKIWESDGKLRFENALELDANLARLKTGKVKAQCFAVFVPPEVTTDDQYEAALQQIQYFYDCILSMQTGVVQIETWDSLKKLRKDEIGAFLSLEGVECIGNDISKLHRLLELGVKSVGLTWNFANLAADGCLEKRSAGLTGFGREVIAVLNEKHVLADVSHLSEASFWEMVELARYPFASHSNAKAICGHERNLSDRQASALFEKEAMIHLAYYPPFILMEGMAAIKDLLKHIDHFCSLGGVRHIGIGSDFDGITSHVRGLENAAAHQNLINELLKHYPENIVRGFASENFLRHLPPDRKVIR